MAGLPWFSGLGLSGLETLAFTMVLSNEMVLNNCKPSDSM